MRRLRHLERGREEAEVGEAADRLVEDHRREALRHPAVVARQRRPLRRLREVEPREVGPSEVFFTFFEAAGGAYYEGSAAERAAAAGGNPETFEA